MVVKEYLGVEESKEYHQNMLYDIAKNWEHFYTKKKSSVLPHGIVQMSTQCQRTEKDKE